MRIAHGGIGTKADDFEQVFCLGLGLFLGHAAIDRAIGQGAHDPLARIERCIGVLKNHLHLVALTAEFFLRQCGKINAANHDVAAIGCHQPNCRAAQC